MMCTGSVYFCLPESVLAMFISVAQGGVCWQCLFLSPREMCAGNIYFCLPGRCVLAMFISVTQEDACWHCLFNLSSSQRGICSRCLSLTSPVWYKSTSARETRMDLCVHCGVLSLQNEQRLRIKILVCVDLPVCSVILDHMAIHVPRIWPLHLLIDSPLSVNKICQACLSKELWWLSWTELVTTSDRNRNYIPWQSDQWYFLGSLQRTQSQKWDLEWPYTKVTDLDVWPGYLLL